MKLLAEERRVYGNGNWPKTEAKKEGGSLFRNMTSQRRNQGGQRGQLTLPKCQEGPAPTWNFCDLLALKLFRRGLESWKVETADNAGPQHQNTGAGPYWSHETTCKKKLLPNRALQRLPTGAGLYCSCQNRPLLKRNSCQSGPYATSTQRSGPLLKLWEWIRPIPKRNCF